MLIPEYENYQESKKHGKDSFPYDTYLCTIPKDFHMVPLHWHDEMEMIYIKKGRSLLLNVKFFDITKKKKLN